FLLNIERHIDARALALCVEKQQVFAPVHFPLHRSLSLFGGDLGEPILYRDLLGIAERQAGFAVRRLEEVLVHAFLIPERCTRKVIRTFFGAGSKTSVLVVGPAGVLDAGPKRLGKWDWIGNVPPVAGESRSDALAFRDRRAAPWAVGYAETPGLVDVVLGAGAVTLLLLGPVHIKEVVAFAEPSDLRLNHIQHRADIVTRSSDVEKFVVLSIDRGTLLPVVTVEISDVGWHGHVPLPIDMVVKRGYRPVTFVRHRDLAGLPER